MAPASSANSPKSSSGSGSLRGEASPTMSVSEPADDSELTYCFSMARTYVSAQDLQRPDRPRDDHSKLSLTKPLTLLYRRLRDSPATAMLLVKAAKPVSSPRRLQGAPSCPRP